LKLGGKGCDKEFARPHVELFKLRKWVIHKGLDVCILFERRDGAGTGGTLKAITLRVTCFRTDEQARGFVDLQCARNSTQGGRENEIDHHGCRSICTGCREGCSTARAATRFACVPSALVLDGIHGGIDYTHASTGRRPEQC
jgi:hypothetical protein